MREYHCPRPTSFNPRCRSGFQMFPSPVIANRPVSESYRMIICTTGVEVLQKEGVHYDVALVKLIHLYSEVFSDIPPEEVESRVHYIYCTALEEDYGCQRQEWKRKRDDGVAGFLAENKP